MSRGREFGYNVAKDPVRPIATAASHHEEREEAWARAINLRDRSRT